MLGSRQNTMPQPLKEFEEALKQLHDRQYDKALARLRKLAEHQDRNAQLRARIAVAVRVCERELTEPPAPDEKDAEALFLCGVYHHNRREFDRAMELFKKALKVDPDGAYAIRYAMAATQTRLRNTDEALELLTRAAAENEKARFMASGDPDFANLRSDKRFQELIRPPKSGRK